MGSAHTEVYRGYSIDIDFDGAGDSPEHWQDGDVIFVSFYREMPLPQTKEGQKQVSHLRGPSDLLAVMAQDKTDTTSKYRVFAVTLNVTSRGVYRNGCSFDGEVFASDFARDEDDDNFDEYEWEESLPRAVIIVKRDHYTRPITTEMLVRMMETGVEPDFDERGAEHHFQLWLSWFDDDVYAYRVSSDAERLLALGVSPEKLRDFELEDACCGFYGMSAAYLRRRKADYDAIEVGDYGGALDEARSLIDGFLSFREKDGALPEALGKGAGT